MQIQREKIGQSGKAVYSLSVSMDQKRLYAGMDDKNIKIFSLENNTLMGTLVRESVLMTFKIGYLIVN